MAVTQKTPAQRARKALILFVIEVAIGAWIGHTLAGLFASEHPIVWAWVLSFACFPLGWTIMEPEFRRTCFESGEPVKSMVGGFLLMLVAVPVGAIMFLPTAIRLVCNLVTAGQPAPGEPISFADEWERRRAT